MPANKFIIAPVAATEALVSGTAESFRVDSQEGTVTALQIVWHDATSAFTAKLYSSNRNDPAETANGTAVDKEIWTEETSVSIAAVTASAAGSQMIHLGNMGARWLQLELTPTANCSISIFANARA